MDKPEQVNVKNLFSAKEETCFRIPDYQREYCWDEERCLPLWDDLMNPENRSEIFFGTFVTNTTKDETGKVFFDVVDGQQRITTFYLILRAGLQYLSEQIGKCEESAKGLIDQDIWSELRGKLRAVLWMRNDSGQRDSKLPRLIINSPFEEAKADFNDIVASFPDPQVFKTLGENIKKKSRYLQNLFFFYDHFQHNSDLSNAFRSINTILDKFQVLHLNCESESEALIVFDTLNNRGIQLKDADIFKSRLYKAWGTSEQQSEFIKIWNEILNKLKDIGSDRFVIDDLFHQYVFHIRMEKNLSTKDIKAVRSFYLDRNLENGHYLENNKESVAANISTLASMWYNLEKRENFSTEVLKWYHCLMKGKNDLWMWAVATYYLKLAPGDNGLDNEQMGKFAKFLKRLTAGIYYCCLSSGGSISDSIKSFVYRVIGNIRSSDDPEELIVIQGSIMKADNLQSALCEIACGSRGHNPVNDKPYVFIHAYLNPKQEALLSLETDIEHIFPKSWAKQAKESVVGEMREGDTDDNGKQYVEFFGNKICLEKLNNIKCSDSYFAQKLDIYENGASATEKSVGVDKSTISDVIDFYTERKNNSSNPVWGKTQIIQRDKDFAEALLAFFKSNIKFSGN